MPSRKKPDIIENFDPSECRLLLKRGAESLGIALSSRQLEQFMNYLDLLSKWNRHINLTGLRSCREIILKHFLDSLTPLPYISNKARVLDLGSGAGFPGLPIKIVRPNQPVTLIEASAKKVSFLKEAARHLMLGSLSIYQTFLGGGPSHLSDTDFFDIIILRAVGKTVNLLTVADPYLMPGGKILFMKGPKGPQEISALKAQINDKGFQEEAPIVLTLPFLEQERYLIFLTKGEAQKS